MSRPQPRLSARAAGLACCAILLAAVANAEIREDDFSMTIMDVFTITGKGVVLTGQVETGTVEVGDWVCVPMLNGGSAGRQVTGLEMFRKVLARAEAGDNVGVLVDGVERKQVAKKAELTAGCSSNP